MSKLAPLGKKDLPKPLALKKLIGPSIIILGVGLGSGELILWPYLTSNFGMGIIWAAVLGITFQFFINMEIQRYTLVTGESIFVGLCRRYGKFSPVWFMGTTFIPWMWPGIAAASATVLAKALGIPYSGLLAIVLLVLMGVFYSLGKVVFATQVKVQRAIILLGVPFIIVLAFIFASSSDWGALVAGLVGKGEANGFPYFLLPSGLPFAAFLGALAYAGAGGNLNLAQSLYSKEKGYGMGKYSGRITNILAGKEEAVALEGNTFELTKKNLDRYKVWWKRVNTEHALVFWATGAFTMVMLALLAYSTVFGNTGVDTSINFVIHEATAIAKQTFPALGTFFLVMAGIMLFGTQFSVLGSNARMMSENLVILDKNKFKIKNLSKYFYIFLWLQILAGVVILSTGFTEPLGLVVTGAVLNAMSMFIYSGMVLALNMTKLAKPLRPGKVRVLAVSAAFVFYGAFSAFVIYQIFS